MEDYFSRQIPSNEEEATQKKLIDRYRIFEVHESKMLFKAFSILKNKEDAEDVVSTIKCRFLGLSDKKFAKIRNVQSYLVGAAANGCKDHFKKESRRKRRFAVHKELYLLDLAPFELRF